ncbi:tail fiber protein [Bradyrhizobium sp. U87765 SZCCT0131]|uniref:tail fiber protein n=1 Tax=unclassified Bradyrhizobium TaxID=2631580 RepID=UPI001BADAAAE|nr:MULTISPECIES: tail fiber protein [unclassified Bradyrhizobium]MBR1219442.1 tail fiber protein [Bradyrhizobium sp. U87765 SZCCT0131]MBR1262093.1 tail fiber protein [Bradyrhizobium sp. U87765 SZCCT0134]MBR1306054.1 tail fiber protein [Bradyrhizobium sp. U87765 SZCCT0110]MBR1317875.1 tail fiber protein [Bradyrhizobium sp. U87765 SZCCT0109]MBR1351577.1 tail fiber protein [Bradyrhizobium sp. U87765 SZCCT0048]
MTFWKWSRTAANNANADPSCPFPEGMAPSAVNDGTRGMMAAAAKYRDDIAGAIVTTGTATAYNISSYQGFDSLAHLDGQQIAFVPHATNSDKCTLSVDGLTAAPIHYQPGVEVPSGTLVQGTPYVVTYFATANEFILRGIAGNPFYVPVGGLIPYISGGVPNSAFVLPYGQPISRTIYSVLFGMIGTAYGAGDGTSTFNIPDLRGRVIAGLDGMGGSSVLGYISTAGSGINGATIGATGGSQNHAIGQVNLPNVGLGVTVADNRTFTSTGTSIGEQFQAMPLPPGGGAGTAMALSAGGTPRTVVINPSTNSISGGTTSMNGNVTQAALWTMPPTIVLPMLLRVI